MKVVGLIVKKNAVSSNLTGPSQEASKTAVHCRRRYSSSEC